MEIASHAYLLTAAVTILALLLYMYIGYAVGAARGKYDIKAPAVTGHPGFERVYRVQMNTVEQIPIFLPALWLATIYFTRLGWLPALLGLIWVIGRFLYLRGYVADPAKRSTGFLISLLAQTVLIILAIAGIVMAWGVT